MCDINTRSGSFEFAHKGRASVCQSLSLCLTSLVSACFTMAEPVRVNVDTTNPMSCHLSSQFSFIQMESAGFVGGTNFPMLS